VTDLGGGGQLTSASGDVEIGTVEGDVHVKTASGDVAVNHASAGEVQAKTATGNVGVGVARDTATLLDCSSITGQVNSELEPSGEPDDAEERRLVIRARTVSGSITIRRA
jgi:DUF4097 and DUF4098 domain-containing protein YvlB